MILIPFFLIFGGWLVFKSQSITTWDQGDYGRVLTSILKGPADGAEYRHWEKPTMNWAFKDPIDPIWQVNNFSEAYFNLHASLQKIFLSNFSLPLLSLISKIIALLLIALLAKNFSKTLGWKIGGMFLIWVMLSASYFMAHNIYILSSFYQEHIFWLGLPLLLSGIVGSPGWGSRLSMIAGAALCGLAKHQFFYIPIMVLIFYSAWNLFRHISINKYLVLGLLIVQAQCIFTLINNNPLQSQYYYHATYYGSYVLLTPSTLSRLNVPISTWRCIGSDRWGVVLAGENGDEEGATVDSCFEQVSLKTNDILLPYLIDPSLLWRMWQFSKTALWTAQPFHNIRRLPYVISPEGVNSPVHSYNTLLYLSDLRERFYTQKVGIVSIFSLLFAFYLLYKRLLDGLPLLILFLLSLLWSQIAIALVGEGFRDLGKHFAAAQLIYDLLLVFLAITIIGCMQQILKRYLYKN
jgi:hypothetical protein